MSFWHIFWNSFCFGISNDSLVYFCLCPPQAVLSSGFTKALHLEPSLKVTLSRLPIQCASCHGNLEPNGHSASILLFRTALITRLQNGSLRLSRFHIREKQPKHSRSFVRTIKRINQKNPAETKMCCCSWLKGEPPGKRTLVAGCHRIWKLRVCAVHSVALRTRFCLLWSNWKCWLWEIE